MCVHYAGSSNGGAPSSGAGRPPPVVMPPGNHTIGFLAVKAASALFARRRKLI